MEWYPTLQNLEAIYFLQKRLFLTPKSNYNPFCSQQTYLSHK